MANRKPVPPARENRETVRIEFTVEQETMQYLKNLELQFQTESMSARAERVMHAIVGARRGVFSVMEKDLQQLGESVQRGLQTPGVQDYIRVELIRIATQLESGENYVVIKPSRTTRK